MKTASEIYAKVHKQTEGHAKDSLDVIYTAMTEFAKAYHEDKTRELNNEIKLLRKSLADMTTNRIFENEESKKLLGETIAYIDLSNTRKAEQLTESITKYITQPLPKLTQNKV